MILKISIKDIECVVMKFRTDIHSPQRMDPNDSGDPPTFLPDTLKDVN